MRLLFGRFLHIELSGLVVQFRSGLMNLTLEILACLLEFAKALTDPTGQFRKFLRSEKKQNDHEDKNDLRPTGHSKGK